jgi:4-hydroxy-tetrahydrodipicolinate reductase
MASVPVLVSGSGKMGRQVGTAISETDDFVLAGYLDPMAPGSEIDGVPLFQDAAKALDATAAAIVIDFTNAAWTPRLAETALPRGARLVVGTTGLSEGFLQWLERETRARGTGAIVASNFALGAVLMMHFAAQAARFFDNAEIIELHHDQKVDAPSGTARTTAERMRAARSAAFRYPPTEKETLPGTRGGELEGIAIHSVRLPGLVAHQEVIFGGLGQTLTIRHDSTGRDSFMPGVLLAARAVLDLDHLVVGLDALLGLE